jgi:hypothetical protein
MLGSDTHNGKFLPIHANPLPGHAGVPVEAPVPKAVADYGYWIPALRVAVFVG